MFTFGPLLLLVMRPLLPVAGLMVGVLAGRRNSDSARSSARLLSVALFAGFLVTAATGWLRSSVFDPSIHHWVAWRQFDLTLFAVPFAIALTIQQHMRQRPLAALSQSAMLLFLLGVTFLVSLSGYLGPDRAARDGRVISEATLNRFLVLHMYFLPVLIPLLLAEWWRFFGARKQAGSSGNGGDCS